MPFVRVSRDKRGYEYFALVHTTSGRRGKVRQRILYWFRTPPNVKVGRPPFDEEVIRALEAQYPDVRFDWDALRKTPMPPPSVEHWREKRRAEKAMRQFRAADETETPIEEPQIDVPASMDSPGLRDDEAQIGSAVADGLEEPGPSESSAPIVATAGSGLQSDTSANPSAGAAAVSEPRRRRRRRRGRRGRSASQPPMVAPQPSPTETTPPSSMGNGSDGPSGDEPGSDEDE